MDIGWGMYCEIPDLVRRSGMRRIEDHEAVILALGALGMALVDHGHVWTEIERGLYDRATKVMRSKGKEVISMGKKKGGRKC